jgi:hypothetical protein
MSEKFHDRESVESAHRIKQRLSQLGVILWDSPEKLTESWNNTRWTMLALSTILKSVEDLSAAIGGDQSFRKKLGRVFIGAGHIAPNAGLTAPFWGGLAGAAIMFNNPMETWGNPPEWTVVHELAHAWDFHSHGVCSRNLRMYVGASRKGGRLSAIRHFLKRDDPEYWYWPGVSPPACGIDRNFNAMEDFAETVTAFLYPATACARAAQNHWPYDPYPDFRSTPRGQFVAKLLAEAA